MSWGAYWRNKFQAHLTFRNPIFKLKVSWHLLRGKKKRQNNPPEQDKMLTKDPKFLPECQSKWWWEINPTSYNHHHHKFTNNKCRWEPGGKRMPLSCLWEHSLAIVSIMESLLMTEKNNNNNKKNNLSERSKRGSDIPTPWPISWESHWWKGAWTQGTLQHCFCYLVLARSAHCKTVQRIWETSALEARKRL